MVSRILISINDSWLMRCVVNGTIKAAGYNVLEATNGYHVVEKAVTHKPDCILINNLMPDMNCFDVLRTLQKEGIDIPVIVLIDETECSYHKETAEVAVIKKPIQKEELLKAIKRVLGSNSVR